MKPAQLFSPRDHALDALRTLAILGMMAAHTARLIAFDARPEWSRLVLLLEPLIPTLFLLLVGISLAMSREAARRRGQTGWLWYARQLKRAAALWGISAVFFTLELGFRLPDALTASGILANIAYAIVIVGGLLAARGEAMRHVLLATVLVGGITLYIGLDLNGQGVFPLNIGNSPFLPLWLFALAGALWGTMFRAEPPVKGRGTPRPYGMWVTAIGVTGGLIAVWLVAGYGVDTLFTKPFGRSDAGRLTPAAFYGGEALHVGYYNLRPVLAAACLGLQLAALVVLGKLLQFVREGRARILFALGRHALGAYILHLALLAILVVIGGRQPLKEDWQGTAVWISLIVACTLFALWRNNSENLPEKIR
jgi:hypothetical protein